MEHLDGGRRQGPEQEFPLPEQTSIEFGHLDAAEPEDGWWDVWVIARGIAAAEREYRNIDDRTARRIAGQLAGGDAAALQRLASTGEVRPELHDELTRDFDSHPAQVRNWINWLGFYCSARADKAPVANWNEPVPVADRADLEALRRNQVIAHLDELFAEPASGELGTADERGWVGLVRHMGRSGGPAFSRDAHGSRHIWETDSDIELAERWTAACDERAATQAEDSATSDGPSRSDRFADVEERLAPLPGLGDIPHPGRRLDGDSGYEWIDKLSPGWHVEPIWGRDGWNLVPG